MTDPTTPTGGSLDDIYDLFEQLDDLCDELGIPYHAAIGMPSGKSIETYSNLFQYDPEHTMATFADMFAGSLKDQFLMHQRLADDEEQ